MAAFCPSKECLIFGPAEYKKTALILGDYAVGCSYRIQVGRGNSLTHGVPQAIDRITVFHHSAQGIFQKAAPLYEKGLSLREIARELDVSKTTIRQTLLSNGVALRPSCREHRRTSSLASVRHIGVAPYGFYCHQGKLFEDTKEQRVVHQIVDLAATGKSLNAIAKHLNGHKVRPRAAKRWDHSIVRSILQRQKTHPITK